MYFEVLNVVETSKILADGLTAQRKIDKLGQTALNMKENYCLAKPEAF